MDYQRRLRGFDDAVGVVLVRPTQLHALNQIFDWLDCPTAVPAVVSQILESSVLCVDRAGLFKADPRMCKYNLIHVLNVLSTAIQMRCPVTRTIWATLPTSELRWLARYEELPWNQPASRKVHGSEIELRTVIDRGTQSRGSTVSRG